MLKFLNKFNQIFTWILMFVITIFIFFSLYNFISIKFMHKNYTNFLGYGLFEVISGSMSPTINVNDLIVVRITDNIKNNDIITYYSDGDFITHRVINIQDDYIITKGDANNSDDVMITHDMVVGKVIFCIANGGVWRGVLMEPKVIILIFITLFLFSLVFSYTPKRKIKSNNIDDDFKDFDCFNR